MTLLYSNRQPTAPDHMPWGFLQPYSASRILILLPPALLPTAAPVQMDPFQAQVDGIMRGLLHKDLRTQCRARGLNPGGNPESLRERLAQHMIATRDLRIFGEDGMPQGGPGGPPMMPQDAAPMGYGQPMGYPGAAPMGYAPHGGQQQYAAPPPFVHQEVQQGESFLAFQISQLSHRVPGFRFARNHAPRTSYGIKRARVLGTNPTCQPCVHVALRSTKVHQC